MVYGEGKSAPTRKHETREEAVTEAKRLARKHNGKFFVLQAVAFVVPEEAPVKVTEMK
jgi:hypothetical protein